MLTKTADLNPLSCCSARAAWYWRLAKVPLPEHLHVVCESLQLDRPGVVVAEPAYAIRHLKLVLLGFCLTRLKIARTSMRIGGLFALTRLGRFPDYRRRQPHAQLQDAVGSLDVHDNENGQLLS